MAKQTIYVQLDKAIDALLAGDASQPRSDLGQLVFIARGLTHLPHPAFRVGLRAQIRRTLMNTTPVKLRPDFHSVTPYLIVPDAERFITFLKTVFGAEERLRVNREDGSVMHAEMKLGDSILELSNGGVEYPARPSALHTYVEDVDAVYRLALEKGARTVSEPADQEYGERGGGFIDAEGNWWYVATASGPHHVMPGLRSVNVYLNPSGAPQFIDFVSNAFGAETVEVYNNDDGSVAHAKVRLGDTVLELSDPHGIYQPMPAGLHYYVDDVDAAYEQALEAGAESISAPGNAPYGDRTASVRDPFGNSWFLATYLGA